MSVTSINGQKTIQQIIDQGTTSTDNRNTGDLGKNDFMNLLVTQMRYQDPLNPTDNQAFIGQMAQFSALEQMQNLNSSFSESQAFGLLGKNITASVTDDKTNETNDVNGNVSNVKMSQGKVYVTVNGQDIPIEDVTEVTDDTFNSLLSSYSDLIGCNVDAITYDSDTGDMINVNGNVGAIQKGTYEDYVVLNGVTAEVAGINSDTTSTDPDYIKNTLQDAYDNNKEISIIIKDSSTGKTVPVTAQIAGLDFSGGKITAVLNDVHAPIEGITNITKPADTNSTDTANTADATGAASTANSTNTADAVSTTNSTNTADAADNPEAGVTSESQ